jgi:hypothetical protein
MTEQTTLEAREAALLAELEAVRTERAATSRAAELQQLAELNDLVTQCQAALNKAVFDRNRLTEKLSGKKIQAPAQTQPQTRTRRPWGSRGSTDRADFAFAMEQVLADKFLCRNDRGRIVAGRVSKQFNLSASAFDGWFRRNHPELLITA